MTFSQPDLQAFWATHVSNFSSQDSELALRILSHYDGQAFNVPAYLLIPDKEDPESYYPEYTREAFSFFGLGTHILYAAEALSRLTRGRSITFNMAILAIIGADIALCQTYRDRIIGSHANAGEVIMRQLFGGAHQLMYSKKYEIILNAIRYHHDEVNNSPEFQVCSIVRQSFIQARVRELYDAPIDLLPLVARWRGFKSKLYRPERKTAHQFYVESSTRVDLSWLFDEMIADELRPLVNLTLPGEFIYLSRKEVLFVEVDMLFKILRKICLQNNWRQILVCEIDLAERWRLINSVVEKFMDSIIAVEYLTRSKRIASYTFENHHGIKRELKLIPFRARQLFDIEKLPKDRPAYASFRNFQRHYHHPYAPEKEQSDTD